MYRANNLQQTQQEQATFEDVQDQALDEQFEDVESRLWENDSSYLIAVSPKIFENNRIRLKIIMGYRVQSIVHGLPSPLDYDSNTGDMTMGLNYLPMGSRYRRRMYQNASLADQLTPQQFAQLPEHQQRRILRDRYLKRQYEQNASLQDAILGGGQQQDARFANDTGMPSLGSLSFWALRNWDQIGWRGSLGMLAFVVGLFKTVQSFYRR